MSDDHSQNNDGPSPKKGFFTLILNQLFQGEPKNRGDLVELILEGVHLIFVTCSGALKRKVLQTQLGPERL